MNVSSLVNFFDTMVLKRGLLCQKLQFSLENCQLKRYTKSLKMRKPFIVITAMGKMEGVGIAGNVEIEFFSTRGKVCYSFTIFSKYFTPYQLKMFIWDFVLKDNSSIEFWRINKTKIMLFF